MPYRPIERPADPLKVAQSLARWQVHREWLIAFAHERGWGWERNLRLGREWLERYRPTCTTTAPGVLEYKTRYVSTA